MLRRGAVLERRSGEDLSGLPFAAALADQHLQDRVSLFRGAEEILDAVVLAGIIQKPLFTVQPEGVQLHLRIVPGILRGYFRVFRKHSIQYRPLKDSQFVATIPFYFLLYIVRQ